MGAFDDLIPQQAPPAAPPPGLFDDLIPKKGDSGVPTDFKGIIVPVAPPRPVAQPQRDFAGVQPGTMAPGAPSLAAPPTPDQTPPGPAGPSQGEALGRGAVTGATLNWGDELAGLNAASGLPGSDTTMGLGSMLVGTGKMIGADIRAQGLPTPVIGADIGGTMPDLTGVPPGPEPGDAAIQARYEAARQKELAANEAARAAYPKTFFAGELGGGLATVPLVPSLAPFKIAAEAPLLARSLKYVGNLAAPGATYGGVAGAGGAEEGERLQGATKGASAGALLAPIVGAGLKGVGSVLDYGISHIAASFAPDVVAIRALRQALERDGTNLEAAIASIREAAARGQQLTLADVAGDNTRALIGSASRLPGPAKTQVRKFLTDRQFGNEDTGLPGQGERISSALTDLVGSKEGSLATADEIMTRRGTQVGPLYQRGDTLPIDYSSTAGQRLAATLDRIPNAAKRKADQILQTSDKSGTQPIWQLAQHGPKAGTYELTTAPNVRQWRYIRQGIDAAIDNNKDTFGRVNTLGKELQDLRADITKELHDVSPLTKAADQIFAGESKMLEALRAGEKMWSVTPEVVEAQIAKLTPGEQEMYRLGGANAMKEKVSKADGINKARIAFGSLENRKKIAAIAPDEASRVAFIEHLKAEKAMFDTRAGTTGGSSTAGYQAEDAEAIRNIAKLPHILGEAAKFNFEPAFREAALHMAKVDPVFRGKVLKSIADIAANPNPQTVEAFADTISKIPMKEGTRQRVISAVMRQLPRTIVTSATGEPNRRKGRQIGVLPDQ